MTNGKKGFPFNIDDTEKIAEIKSKIKPGELCENAPFMLNFAEYVYGLKFEDEPNYGYLRFLLTKNLLEKEMIPSEKYDWIGLYRQPSTKMNVKSM
jgi:hypothetical protein